MGRIPVPITPMTTNTWKTKDGRVLNIRDMEDTHIVNAIKVVRRRTSESISEYLVSTNSNAAIAVRYHIPDTELSKRVKNLVNSLFHASESRILGLKYEAQRRNLDVYKE